jgi:DNA recombination protein RmuC
MESMQLILSIITVALLLVAIILLLTGKKKSDLGEISALLKRTAREQCDSVSKQIGDGATKQFEHFGIIQKNVQETLKDNREETNKQLDRINTTLENKMKSLQDSNEKRLAQMQGVVEEKLEKTLNERLKLSFETVSKNLESVQKGLGEMQSLAMDVGGLKKAISNVKTRGVFGEVQLERILEQMLTSSQYEKNVQVKDRTQERVEFAIKLPGKNEDESSVYLPIDSKFPSEDYDALLSAYDIGDKPSIDAAKKVFANKIKSFAKDISGKYINPPSTTDFAILFLPFESLYAEVVQTPGLFEDIQINHKITVTGPTTLSAFLNALQIGFKTLTIEKRTSEVWDTLGAVKTEFKTFGDVLNNVQRKLLGANEDLSKLIGTRTRAINRKLRNIEELPESETYALLPINSDDEE